MSHPKSQLSNIFIAIRVQELINNWTNDRCQLCAWGLAIFSSVQTMVSFILSVFRVRPLKFPSHAEQPINGHSAKSAILYDHQDKGKYSSLVFRHFVFWHKSVYIFYIQCIDTFWIELGRVEKNFQEMLGLGERFVSPIRHFSFPEITLVEPEFSFRHHSNQFFLKNLLIFSFSLACYSLGKFFQEILMIFFYNCVLFGFGWSR